MLRFKNREMQNYQEVTLTTFNELAEYKKGPFGSALKKEIFVPKSNDAVKVYEQQNVILKDWTLERYFITNEYAEKMKAFNVFGGDIIVSCAGTIGEIYEMPEDAEQGVINQALMRVRVNNEFINKKYFMHVFDKMLSNEGKKLSNGSALKNIPPLADLKSQEVFIPCLEEQQKIADCLSSVDELISDYEKKVENMQSQKKGVMQKLFSQEVRFKADDGSEFPDWEEKAFDEIYAFMKNNTFSRDCLNYEGGEAKNIHYGDVLIKYGAVINVEDETVPFINNDLDISKYGDGALLKDGDIIIADTAEDSSVGKATEIQKVQGRLVLSGLHTIPCRPRQEFAPSFLGYYMNSEQYQKQTWPLIQGIKVSSISRGAISKTIITYPCIEEQQKIADCLTAFDNAIEDLQKTVEHWKNIKKGLLQQLFDWEGVYNG